MARIQQMNLCHMEQKDIGEMFKVCFRKPDEGETSKAMSCTQMLELIKQEYPSLTTNHSTKVHLGFALKELGIEFTLRSHVPYYKVVPLSLKYA